MKNIIILGISRSGKTTLSNIIKDKYQYNIIHADMIKASYQKHITNKTSDELKNDSNYRLFIKDIFYHEVKYNKTNCVLDTVDIYPEDITDIDKEKYLIYFLGYPNIEINKLISIWKKTDLEFTKKYSEEKLILKAKKNIQKSKELQEKCKKYNLSFIDTTYNRNKVFEKILEEIKNS